MHKLLSSKAQSSVELITIVGAVLFFFIVIIAALHQGLGNKNTEKRNFEFQEVATLVQNELNIAAKSSNGYSRTFTIPQKIEGFDYSIQIIESSIYINSTEAKFASAIPAQNVTGQIQKGDNFIRKIDGVIYLN